MHTNAKAGSRQRVLRRNAVDQVFGLVDAGAPDLNAVIGLGYAGLEGDDFFDGPNVHLRNVIARNGAFTLCRLQVHLRALAQYCNGLQDVYRRTQLDVALDDFTALYPQAVDDLGAIAEDLHLHAVVACGHPGNLVLAVKVGDCAEVGAHQGDAHVGKGLPRFGVGHGAA